MASARKGSRPFLLGGIATIDNSARRPDVKYRAFVSFSHESDGRLARALESSLSRFAKPWYRIRTMRIFQDKVSLHRAGRRRVHRRVASQIETSHPRNGIPTLEPVPTVNPAHKQCVTDERLLGTALVPNADRPHAAQT